MAAEREPLFGRDLGVTPPVVMKQVRAMGVWNVLAHLEHLREVPTLVESADQDIMAKPEVVRVTAKAIPGSELVELSNAAHGITVTEPTRINYLLEQHIARVEAPE